MIYLDSAATSLIKPACVEHAVVSAMRTMASPGRGGHLPALRAAEEVYAARETAAELFHAEDSTGVVFTANATHALNIAIKSVAKAGMRVVISGFEHNSVTRPLAAIGADICPAGTRLFDTADTLTDFEAKIRGAELVVCTYVSNVFGYILPVYEIGEMCRARGVPYIVDASQAAGVLDVDFQRLHADFVAMPGHKALFGPQGTGIAGPRAGMEYTKTRGRENIYRHEALLLRRMRAALEGTDGLELFTGETQCGVLSVRAAGMGCEELAEKLSVRGVCVRAGLHCAPRAHMSAGTLTTGTVRFSFSPFTTEDQVAEAAEILKDILNTKSV